jgi:hypothetical protein
MSDSPWKTPANGVILSQKSAFVDLGGLTDACERILLGTIACERCVGVFALRR